MKHLALAGGVTLVVFLAELIGGLVTGSLALLSDAMHMLSDATGLIIALLAGLVSRRAANSRATYGYSRVEVLAALVNAVVVTAVTVWIALQAVTRFRAGAAGVEIDTAVMFGIAVVGLVANAVSALILMRAEGDNLNIRGALLHVMADLMGSVAVIIAAVVIWLTEFTAADTIASFVIVALVLPRAVGLLRSALTVLLEQAPQGVTANEVVERLSGIAGVQGVHDVHVWSTNGVQPLATAHVVVAEADYRILDEAQAALAELGIEHSTLQLEPPGHAGHERYCIG